MNREEVRARIEEIGIVSGDSRVVAGGCPICRAGGGQRRNSHRGTHDDCARSDRSDCPPGPERARVDRRRGHGLGYGNRAPLSGCGSEVSDHHRARSQDRGVRGPQKVVIFPGALTPTEVMMAWKAGVDFVKVFPCSQLGGAAVYQSPQGAVSPSAADCLGRREPAKRRRILSGRRRGGWHRRAPGPEEGDRIAPAAPDS